MRNRTQFLLALPLALALLAVPLAASAGLYLRATGSAQGTIAGESTAPGRHNWIDITSFSHQITTPIDPNGIPTGPAQTSPLSLSKLFDRATVKLFQAAANQEIFTEVRLEFTEIDQQGQETTIYRIELTDGRLIDMAQAGSSSDVSEAFSFSYARVTLTDIANGTVAVYDWYSVSTAPPADLAKGILLPPAPNPTSGATEFRFALPVASNADLTLYDLRGRLVRELHHGWTATEPVVAVWDGTDERGAEVAQGLYVARLTYPGRVVTQRVAVLR